ncbi:MAG: DUF4214 domain-containing protein, partial [Clostridia bacterium]|nr:DUF4214 domain-containing protein [Clostridia bacterium]
CNVCGAVRTITHTYEHECSETCSVCGEKNPDAVAHTYDNDCDTDCNVCGAERTITHTYEHECSETCSVCGEKNPDAVEHSRIYCDDDKCSVCGADIVSVEHQYDSDSDKDCNVCGKERIAPADQKAAAEVEELINNLPDDPTLDDTKNVEDARKAYEELTDDQKALIDDETVQKLEDAEKKIEELQDEKDKKDKADQDAADKVEEKINNIPENPTLDDEKKIEDARKAYDELTEEQKKLVDAEILQKLKDAEKKLNDLKNAPTPTVLPTPGTITPIVSPAIVTPTPAPEPTHKLNVGDFVIRCYEVALDRAPDEQGYKYWTGMLNEGQACGAQVGFGFIFSEEYTSRNKDNGQFLVDLYKMYFDREPDVEGYNYWIEKLNNGADRQEIFAGFANSLEFYNLCLDYGVVSGYFVPFIPNEQQGGVNCFVARLYRVCLDRLPDQEGHAYWVTQLLNKEISGSGCAFGFVFSPEFTGRDFSNSYFVSYMYRAFFGREADEDGLVYWVEMMDNGATREDIFNGFVGSPEFANLCASYGIDV